MSLLIIMSDFLNSTYLPKPNINIKFDENIVFAQIIHSD